MMPSTRSAPSAASSVRAILPYPFNEAIIPVPSLPPVVSHHSFELVSEGGYRQGSSRASAADRCRAIGPYRMNALGRAGAREHAGLTRADVLVEHDQVLHELAHLLDVGHEHDQAIDVTRHEAADPVHRAVEVFGIEAPEPLVEQEAVEAATPARDHLGERKREGKRC